MGNNNSLHVDYEELNKSCEQMECAKGGPETADSPKRHIITIDDAKTTFPDKNPWMSVQSLDTIDSEMRAARSLPNVHHEQPSGCAVDYEASAIPPRERCNTISQPIRIPLKSSLTVENVERNSLQQEKQSRSKQVPSCAHTNDSSGNYRPCVELVPCDDIVIHVESLQSPDSLAPRTNAIGSPYAVQLSSSTANSHLYVPKAHNRRIGSAPADFMADFVPLQGEKIPHHLVRRCRHYSAGFDDYMSPPSTSSTAPLVTGTFQRPRRGQTLVSFLESFSSSDSELERENAHFNICQAVICAIEQMKWNSQLRKMRKSQSESESFMSTSSEGNRWNDSFSSDGEQNEPSMDMESDMMNETPVSTAVEWTREENAAEVIGLSLVSRFSNLPKASDIHWFDDGSGFFASSGSNDWAPPRPQIIFTRKGVEYVPRKKALQDQNFRCRGCGIQVSLEYCGTFRLCGYTGQYYCTACHRNQMSVIPARILDDWNFKLYPVAVGAYRLLEEIWYSPLFYVATINAQLFRVPALASARKVRGSLRLARDHIFACRWVIGMSKIHT